MWSVDCFGGGVVVGVNEEAGGEPVGTYFVGAVVAGWVAVVRVPELVGQRAQGGDIIHAYLHRDCVLCGHPRRLRAAAVPPDSVSPPLRHINKGIGVNQSNLHLVSPVLPVH